MSKFAYRDHITIGDSQNAMDWIRSSSLIQQDRDALMRFVGRFSGLTFFKEDDAALDYVQDSEKIILPIRLREIRKTIAYVNPDEPMVFQISHFDHWSPRADVLEEIWYRFALIGYSNDDDRDVLEAELLFPIAEAWKTGRSSLALRLADEETAIFEYNLVDLWDNESEGESPTASIRLVFASYATLLERIIAFQSLGGIRTAPVQ